MKRILTHHWYLALLAMVLVFLPALSKAQPPDPGGDPFGGSDATPVDGGVAVVLVLAFIYGVYRIIALKGAKESGRGHE